MVPRILPILLLTIIGSYCQAAETWETEYDRLLGRYVTEQGVRYEAWHRSTEDRRKLENIAQAIAQTRPGNASKSTKLAFYLNAYNALILHEILRDYPTAGPGGSGFIGRNLFFRHRKIRVAGQVTTFHKLENDVIRREFSEPRIHFALNCASRSCPPLHTRAFTGDSLETTLEALTRSFITSNPRALRRISDGGIEISKIFDWYADDFAPFGGVRAFMNRYLEPSLSSDETIRHQDYDWSLNQVP